jgi:alanyl-tRNA synthetase
MFTVLSSENYKGGTRLSVLSGFRALSYTKNNQTVLEEISHTLKLPTEQLSFGVKKLLDDCDNYRRTISNLQASLLEIKCKNLPLDVANICIIIPETDSRVMRDCINDLKLKHTGYVMIINESAKQNSFIIGSNNKNCNELVLELKKTINIKGGGKPEMVQGSFDCDIETITSVLKDKSFEII